MLPCTITQMLLYYTTQVLSIIEIRERELSWGVPQVSMLGPVLFLLSLAVSLLSLSSANKCLLKVGHYSAQLEQYPKAIEIYEQVCFACILKPWNVMIGSLWGMSQWCNGVCVRWPPIPWTTPCWSIMPKSTSLKPPSVTSLWTNSTQRYYYHY